MSDDHSSNHPNRENEKEEYMCITEEVNVDDDSVDEVDDHDEHGYQQTQRMRATAGVSTPRSTRTPVSRTTATTSAQHVPAMPPLSPSSTLQQASSSVMPSLSLQTSLLEPKSTTPSATAPMPPPTPPTAGTTITDAASSSNNDPDRMAAIQLAREDVAAKRQAAASSICSIPTPPLATTSPRNNLSNDSDNAVAVQLARSELVRQRKTKPPTQSPNNLGTTPQSTTATPPVSPLPRRNTSPAVSPCSPTSYMMQSPTKGMRTSVVVSSPNLPRFQTPATPQSPPLEIGNLQPPTSTTSPSPPMMVPPGAWRIHNNQSGAITVEHPSTRPEEEHDPQDTSDHLLPMPQPNDRVVNEAFVVTEDDDNNAQHLGRSTSHHSSPTQQQTHHPQQEQPQSLRSTTSNDYEQADVPLVVEATRPSLLESVKALLQSRRGRWGILALILIIATTTIVILQVLANNEVVQDVLSIANPPPPPTIPHNGTLLGTAPSQIPSRQPTTRPSLMPTMAPTTGAPSSAPTRSDFTLDDLPLATQEQILANANNYNNPQWRAWQWMQEDVRTGLGRNSALSKRRLRQRYALVTFYYATRGNGWSNSRFWLDQTLHECNWWPHVRGPAWPFTEGPVVCQEGPDVGREVTNPNEAELWYTHLLMANNELLGTLPFELTMLSSLRVVDVSQNPLLSGTLPPGLLEHLSLLETVRLQFTGLSGTVALPCNSSENATESDKMDPIVVQLTCNAGLSCNCGCACI